MHRALDRIVTAWPAAFEAAQARGFGPGGSERSSSSDVVDPTGSAACRPSQAERWLKETRCVLMLTLSWARIQRAWPGSPGPIHEVVGEALDELIEWWPNKLERLLDRIVGQANFAAEHWPATPRKGEVIDGIKVGGRSSTIETCIECRQTVSGGAGDPIVRIDGQPYHRKPCYQTAWQRRKRAERKANAAL